MDMVIQKDIGSVVENRVASTPLVWTAAGTGDNTTLTGISIDREAVLSGGAGSPALSAKFTALFGTTLASGATLNIAWTILDSADNSTFATYASAAGVTVATGVSGGGVVNSHSSINVNLSSAKRYIRADIVPNLSASGTDTAVAIIVATLAGFDRLPAPT
jgi:hypothetical protein